MASVDMFELLSWDCLYDTKNYFHSGRWQNFRPFSHTICEISQKFPHQKTFYIVKDAGTRDNWKVYEVEIKNKTCEIYIIWEKATEKKEHMEVMEASRKRGRNAIDLQNERTFVCLAIL